MPSTHQSKENSHHDDHWLLILTQSHIFNNIVSFLRFQYYWAIQNKKSKARAESIVLCTLLAEATTFKVVTTSFICPSPQ